jgi:hypothetical protein
MSRTRVHNLNISLDGYAAGDHVTFDAPIGGADRLFGWFDGRAIHGVDKLDAPFTLDGALTRMWGQGIGAEIMGRRKFGPQVGDGESCHCGELGNALPLLPPRPRTRRHRRLCWRGAPSI